ncbi:MAG TPA: NAD(P)-dependent oxidoreductase [Bryobacteraceae bacterium]
MTTLGAKIGFIGLGAMGLPMAERIVNAGFETFITVHRRREPSEQLESLGAQVLGTPALVGQAADVVITMLPADQELKQVVFGEHGLVEGFAPGKILVDMTTASVMSLREVENAIVQVGGRVLDAPVSGGTTGAARGTLTVIAGGDPGLLEECRPLLSVVATRIMHVGGTGQGKVVKMVNQVMAALNLFSIGEAFSLGMSYGVSPEILYDVIKTSSGYSKMMDLKLPHFLLVGSFEPGFKMRLMKKDLDIALESGRSKDVPLTLTSLIARDFAEAIENGNGEADYSLLAQVLANRAAVNFNQKKEN